MVVVRMLVVVVVMSFCSLDAWRRERGSKRNKEREGRRSQKKEAGKKEGRKKKRKERREEERRREQGEQGQSLYTLTPDRPPLRPEYYGNTIIIIV